MIKTISKNRFKSLASALLKENIVVDYQIDWSMTTTSGDYGYTDQPRIGSGTYNGIDGWYFTRNCNDNFTPKQKKLINEIETLRTAGDVDSNDRADILRDELLDEKRHLEHLSAFYLKSCGGDSDSK